MVYRVYVEKKAEYAVEARGLARELRELLGLERLKNLRVVQRYDVEGISEALFRQCIPTVFSEPPLDEVLPALPQSDFTLAVEYLPGQFDQRADSAAECIQLISMGERPAVASARVYLLEGSFSEAEQREIEKYLINPVEARRADLAEKQSVRASYPAPPDVKVLDGFIAMPDDALEGFIAEYALAMDRQDLAFCRDYFKGEGRDPSITELRMVDTYWSDHCRHTTFSTILDHVELEDEKAQKTWQKYEEIRAGLYAGRTDKPRTLMDLATIGAKELKRRGKLENLDESEEINACSVKVQVDVDGVEQPWLLQFKNETHNHPTEIEPFGGAATCIGGAIRDPLAGRAYVYQAMRVTGAANPLAKVSETLPGKLPQRKLVTTAAAGYSSYGNQIGLATGQVREIYHPGYVAKRMEVGAVLGAVPEANVRREVPQPGDVIILLGGRTGRDGCGGATGSSKAHKAESLEECGAEVQKGNAPVERKLQRLFRNPQATLLIRRCNDFGAGGVSVAIGELADGLMVDLDAVPKKYEGLDGTELAISESQERMAVVVEAGDVEKFIALAETENLEATPVATVQAEKRLQMKWRGKIIVDIARDFLNSNGAEKHATARVPAAAVQEDSSAQGSLQERLEALASDLNHCGQKGLSERFDSTIGAATVLAPFGGKHQLTAPQAMVAKLPVLGETSTVSGMAFGFDPFISSQSPYTGAYLAVLESLAKLVATGFALDSATLTFQEYFERLGTDPTRWGKPLAALLGALQAQLDFGAAAIGGKDSMSGSFEQLDVPPTLISFAVAAGRAEHIVSPEFKLPGSKTVLLAPAYEADGLTPKAASFRLLAKQVEKLMETGKALSTYACGAGGLAEAVFQMGLGNRLGFRFAENWAKKGLDALFAPAFGSFVVELAEDAQLGEFLGETTAAYEMAVGQEAACLECAQEQWESKLEAVFPYRGEEPGDISAYRYEEKADKKLQVNLA